MRERRQGNCRLAGLAGMLLLICIATICISASAPLAAAQTAVTTYHYDNNRTGWNQNESVLTPANVASSSFGLLQTVALNDQVDAQPLVVPGGEITAGQYQGAHEIGR